MKEETMTTRNLRYSYLGAGDAGENRHAQVVMKELGITWRESIPQTIADQWWFLGCEDVPASLPAYVNEIDPETVEEWTRR